MSQQDLTISLPEPDLRAERAEYMREYRASGKGKDTRTGRKRTQAYRKDTRTGRGGKKKSNWAYGNIRAWDGEAVTDNLGHRYVLLSSSDPSDRLVVLSGITTRDALEFLCQPRQKNVINVSYGFSYDVNMILRDLPIEKLQMLWLDGYVTWENFRIWYTWRRKFTVQQLGSPTFVNKEWNIVGQITIWDSLGFSQSSFVNAVRQWLPDEATEWLAEMKAGRSSFQMENLDEIIRYNDLENQLLVKIMNKCFQAHKQAGITLRRYDGAGASAAAVLEYQKVKDYMRDEPEEIYEACLYAYAGGRIEALKIGNAANRRIYRYDINSAYPSTIRNLPCLRHGRWYHNPSPTMADLRKDSFAVVHVRWISGNAAFHPFFYRDYDGTILYPSQGEGWFWLPEVEAAWADDKCQVELVEAYQLARDCRHEPFAFLPLLYDLRLRYKAEGNYAQYALKLAMNAMYGKMAQKAGYHHGRKPSFHQLSWAGYVTSQTRASMYRACMGHQGFTVGGDGRLREWNDIITFATDGIYTVEPLDGLPIGSSLGEWSTDTFDGMTIAQAGVYWLRTGNEWEAKYRGFDQDSLSREGVIAAWESRQDYAGTVTRFVGVGSAAFSPNQWDTWRTWITSPRRLDIYPTGKRIEKRGYNYARGLRDTLPAWNERFDELGKPHYVPWKGALDYSNTVEGLDEWIWEDECDDAAV